MIQSGNSADRVLDINSASQANGGNLETYYKNNTANQRFYISYGSDGYYTIKAGHSGKYIDVSGGSSLPRTNAHQWEYNNTDAQKWKIIPLGNGYYYIQSKLGTLLDNENNSTKPGNNVILYSYSGAAAQKWTFVKTSSPSPDPVPVPDNSFITQNEISNAARNYGIGTGTNAYNALLSINTKYSSRLKSNKNGMNIFLFEGAGNNSSAGSRMNAMCVVVSNGRIIYINRNSSTIPDYPFTPSKNGGTAMPTIRDGIYNFTTVNHKGQYAALNVNKAAVVRFSSKNSYWNSSSSAINVHRRSSDSIAPSKKSWVNSAGCQLIGRNSEYFTFVKTIGICNRSSIGTYTSTVSGKIIIDRTYAYNYLRNIGYPDGAISMLRG